MIVALLQWYNVHNDDMIHDYPIVVVFWWIRKLMYYLQTYTSIYERHIHTKCIIMRFSMR